MQNASTLRNGHANRGSTSTALAPPASAVLLPGFVDSEQVRRAAAAAASATV